MAKKQTAANTPAVATRPATRQLAKPEEIENPVVADTADELTDDADDTPLEPITAEELDALIDAGEEEFLALNSAITTQYALATRELVAGLMTLNSRNRYMTPSWVAELTSRFLTPLTDDRGRPIKGTSQWVYGLPTKIYMDNLGSVHNGQHTLTAWITALDELAENQRIVREGGEVHADLVKDYGITEEMLGQFTLEITRGIPEEAVDLIDASKQRDVSDVLYRKNFFADQDYSYMVAEGKTPSSSQILRWQNEEADKLAMVLRFLHYRFSYNGAGPRGSSAKFPAPAAVRLQSDYPGTVDSVHRVWLIIRSNGKAGTSKLTKCGVSMQYLMCAHYLIMMSDATHKKSGWEYTDEALEKADAFVFSMLFDDSDRAKDASIPPDIFKGHRLASQIRQALTKVDPSEGDREHNFIEGNKGLDAKFHALGWAWRDIAGLKVDPKMVDIKAICSGKAGFSRYTDEPKGFDMMPVVALPDVAAVRAAATPIPAATVPVAASRALPTRKLPSR